MKIRCAIIDDEFLARKYLMDYVSKIDFLELVGDYNSPLKVMQQINSLEVDLLFLDIRMPDISGLEFLRSIKKQPYVILTTAYSEYAIEGFELNVVDYLLKPFPFDRFLNAVNKVADLMSGSNQAKQASDDKTETHLHDDYIIVKADRKLYKINYDDLKFIEGQKAYVTYHTNKTKITALGTLRDLELSLPEKRFIRIHKSYIVSIRHIEILEGNQVVVAGNFLPIGKIYKENVDKIFEG